MNAAQTTKTRPGSAPPSRGSGSQIAAKNKELAQLRTDVPALVRAVNQLTLENQQLRDDYAGSGSVVPFPGRAPARPAVDRPRREGLPRCHPFPWMCPTPSSSPRQFAGTSKHFVHALASNDGRPRISHDREPGLPLADISPLA